jgi:putative ABC transport system permease protein
VLHADDRSRVRIQTPASLVELRGIVEAELSSNSRQLLLVVLGIGLVVVMVTQAGAVAQRRRDFGRRRALGATRSAVTVLVIVQTISSAFVGVVLGSVAGVVAILMSTGSPPPFDFVTALAILALLSAVLAAVPPGIGAAFRDPVRILRVP